MDTSEEYIKMCQKADELYLWCKEKYGEYTIPAHSFYYKITQDEIRVKSPYMDIGNAVVWLPRQDQLQEMLRDWDVFKDSNLTTLFEVFYDFVLHFGMNADSAEKLWLAFVMKTKHNKTWDGEQWNLPQKA